MSWGGGVNFVVMTILREHDGLVQNQRHPTPLPSVSAPHPAYIAELCAPACLDDLSDETALKQSETAPVDDVWRGSGATGNAMPTAARSDSIRQGLSPLYPAKAGYSDKLRGGPRNAPAPRHLPALRCFHRRHGDVADNASSVIFPDRVRGMSGTAIT